MESESLSIKKHKKPIPKEIGKVKPFRIQKTGKSSLVEKMNSLNDVKKWSQENEEFDDEEEEVSLMEETTNNNATMALLINPIDPTKDFYTSSGRPVSPVLPPPIHEMVEEPERATIKQNDGDTSTTSMEERQVSEDVIQGRSGSGGSSTVNSERVKVVVRSRPLSDKEKSERHEW
jgi:hypothetical protein